MTMVQVSQYYQLHTNITLHLLSTTCSGGWCHLPLATNVTQKIENSGSSHLFIKCCFETQITRTHQEFFECLSTGLWSRFLGSIRQLTNSELYRVAFVRLIIWTISDVRRQLVVNPTWLTTTNKLMIQPLFQDNWCPLVPDSSKKSLALSLSPPPSIMRHSLHKFYTSMTSSTMTYF